MFINIIDIFFTMVFDKLKERINNIIGKSSSEEYVELDLGEDSVKKSKVLVKTFVLKAFDDVNAILNSLREGYTIGVIDIRPLRQKDIIELKRAISKIKKTADALEGSIAGFGENIIIVTPSFAEIYKHKADAPKPVKDKFL